MLAKSGKILLTLVSEVLIASKCKTLGKRLKSSFLLFFLIIKKEKLFIFYFILFLVQFSRVSKVYWIHDVKLRFAADFEENGDEMGSWKSYKFNPIQFTFGPSTSSTHIIIYWTLHTSRDCLVIVLAVFLFKFILDF